VSDYRGLTTVLVKRDELLEQMRLNRADHRQMFEQAMEGYKVKAVELLMEHIDRIKANVPEKVVVSLPFPEDHTGDYDRVIVQLEWSLDDTLELNEQEFNSYVRDQWGWQQGFTQTWATYTSSS
jgi:hypothetical protein